MSKESKSKALEISVQVERKQPDLPRYAVIPSATLKPWRLSGTTTIDMTINGVPVERRTIKRWDENRWFLSVTEKDCRLLDIETGSRVTLTLRVASVELPPELTTLIKDNRA